MSNGVGKVGDRVRLITTAKGNGVKPGDTGTIWHIVPSNGVRRVKWDCGAKLDLNPECDTWGIIEPA
jgi:hypothetical protein